MSSVCLCDLRPPVVVKIDVEPHAVCKDSNDATKITSGEHRGLQGGLGKAAAGSEAEEDVCGRFSIT